MEVATSAPPDAGGLLQRALALLASSDSDAPGRLMALWDAALAPAAETPPAESEWLPLRRGGVYQLCLSLLLDQLSSRPVPLCLCGSAAAAVSVATVAAIAAVVLVVFVLYVSAVSLCLCAWL